MPVPRCPQSDIYFYSFKEQMVTFYIKILQNRVFLLLFINFRADDNQHSSKGMIVSYQNMLQAQCTVSSSSIIMRLRSISSRKLCSGSSITLYCFQLSTRWIVAMDCPLETESRKVTYHRFPLPALIKFPSRSFRFLESFAYLDEDCC